MQVQYGRGKQIKGLMSPISEPAVCFYNADVIQRKRTGITAVLLVVVRWLLKQKSERH